LKTHLGVFIRGFYRLAARIKRPPVSFSSLRVAVDDANLFSLHVSSEILRVAHFSCYTV
jgi:hypothetical protein